MEKWNSDSIPSQKDRVALVTGANSGLGFHTSLALAKEGARVIMACRNLEKGRLARDKILESLPVLYGATSPDLVHGAYDGRGGLLRLKGSPRREETAHRRVNELVAREFWAVSEELTGIAFDLA